MQPPISWQRSVLDKMQYHARGVCLDYKCGGMYNPQCQVDVFILIRHRSTISNAAVKTNTGQEAGRHTN